MNIRQFFIESVLPAHSSDAIAAFYKTYPEISLTAKPNTQPLSEALVLMLVALTGTGKSTTLDQLEVQRKSGEIDYEEVIPSRRDIADFIIIPTAQKLLGEEIQPVKDRVRRFFYTGTFAEHVPGGMAAAYSWLHVPVSNNIPIISEGIRGGGEIAYSLEHCPGWSVVELTVSPIVRLKRLSNREDEFDKAAGTDDVDFLPEKLQPDIIRAIESGEITTKALSIVRAEAKNYGLDPFATPHSNTHPSYHCIDTESRPPEQVANEVRQVLETMRSHATH